MNSLSHWASTTVSSLYLSQSPPDEWGTADKIRAFGSLPSGWHYGRGGPATDEVIAGAQDYLSLFVLLGFDKTNAFAGADGEIMVTAYKGSHCIEVTIELDRSFVVSHQWGEEDGDYLDNLTGSQASLRIVEIAQAIEREQCNIFVSCKSNILTAETAGSRTSLLRTHRMEAEYQSYWNPAVWPQVEQYAPISNVITPALEATHRYFGLSMIQTFPWGIRSFRTRRLQETTAIT